jgi:hypothetical protein
LWDTDDKTYTKAVQAIEGQFERRKFVIPGLMLHIFALRLFFAKTGIIDGGGHEVFQQCQKYIQDVVTQGKLANNNREPTDVAELDHWDHLGFGLAADTGEWKQLRSQLNDALIEIRKKQLPDEAQELLQVLHSDATAFFRQLCANAYETAIFADIPILSAIPVDQFVDVVLELDPRSQKITFDTFRCRYELPFHRKRLEDERPWLERVGTELKGKIGALSKISQYRLGNEIRVAIDAPLKSWQEDAGPKAD